MHYKDYYYYYEDLLRVIAGYPNIEFRFIVTPTQDLPSRFFPIYATVEEIKLQLGVGEADAAALINKYLAKQKTEVGNKIKDPSKNHSKG